MLRRADPDTRPRAWVALEDGTTATFPAATWRTTYPDTLHVEPIVDGERLRLFSEPEWRRVSILHLRRTTRTRRHRRPGDPAGPDQHDTPG